jgi:hypothetical protein
VDDCPVYEFSVNFFTAYLGIHHETGLRYLRLGVLKPDARTRDKRPLFAVDPESIERHKSAIRAYKLRRRAAAHNLKDLAHV